MNPMLMKRTGALAAAFAITGAALVACSQEAKDSTKDAASSASSVASSAVDAGTSAAKSGASDASNAMTSAAAGAPTTINAPGIGEVTLDGPTAEAFSKAGGEATLGLPTAQPEKVGDGTVQAFANGTIYSSPTAGAHVVQGEILRVYTENGGPAGKLGFPSTDEAETAGGPDVADGGWISEFEHGTITWLNKGGGAFAETVTPK
ncbi:MAG: LGFP repeat-containing protein [Mycobacterium sp.]